MKVSGDGNGSTHACLLVARRSSPAEEEVGTEFSRIRAHPVAMANSGPPRGERGHQSKGTRGASRNRTDHAWPHPRQARDAGINRTAPTSDRPRAGLLHFVEAVHPKLEKVRELGDVTRSEALAGMSEAGRQRRLKTLEAMKANLTEACEAPIAGQERARHG